MILTQNSGTVFDGLFVQVDGLVRTARRLVCVCEVVTRNKGVGMILTQAGNTALKGLFVQVDGLFCAAHRQERIRKLVARGEGVAVVWSQEFPDDVHSLIEGECFERKPKVMRMSKSHVQSVSDLFKGK